MFIARKNLFLLIGGGALVVSLAWLAALQYRWVGQLGEAEGNRIKAHLRAVAERCGREIDEEITGLYRAFLLLPSEDQMWREAPEQVIGSKYEQWLKTAAHPELLSGIWLTKDRLASGSDLARFDFDTRRLTDCEWPAKLSELRDLVTAREAPDSRRGRFFRDPAAFRSIPIFSEAPALVIPVITRFFSRGEPGRFIPPPPRPVFLIADLNRSYIRDEFLPSLVKQFFPNGGQDYQLAIVTIDPKPTVIYQSEGGVSPGLTDPAKADVACQIFGLLPELLRPPTDDSGPGETNDAGRGANRPFFPGPRMRSARLSSGADGSGNPNGAWLLLVRHRSGSLESVVKQLRRRNLAISAVILAVLGGSVLLLLVATRRTQELARRQIQFVASVTHELRTPLSVVHAAGENLADGIVKTPSEIRSHGELVRDHSRRLTEIVEQILGYAGAESGRPRERRLLNLEDVIDEALEACRTQLEEGGFIVERKVEKNLPLVRGDSLGLNQALENLINNAVKYSGACWLQVSANARRKGKREGVALSVRDMGVGIPSEELPHVFEPFYRGRAVAEGRIRGSGLGLSLVKSIIESHEGVVGVESRSGAGSTFTVWLPAGPEAAALREETREGFVE